MSRDYLTPSHFFAKKSIWAVELPKLNNFKRGFCWGQAPHGYKYTDHIVILCSNMRQPIKIARASTLYSDTYDNYDIIDPSCTNFLPAGRNIICLCRVRSDDTIRDALLFKCSWEIPKQDIVKTLYVNEKDNSTSSGVMLQVIDKRQPQSLKFLSAGHVQTEESHSIRHMSEGSRNKLFPIGRKYDAKWIVDGEMRSTCNCDRWSE